MRTQCTAMRGRFPRSLIAKLPQSNLPFAGTVNVNSVPGSMTRGGPELPGAPKDWLISIRRKKLGCHEIATTVVGLPPTLVAVIASTFSAPQYVKRGPAARFRSCAAIFISASCRRAKRKETRTANRVAQPVNQTAAVSENCRHQLLHVACTQVAEFCIQCNMIEA